MLMLLFVGENYRWKTVGGGNESSNAASLILLQIALITRYATPHILHTATSKRNFF